MREMIDVEDYGEDFLDRTYFTYRGRPLSGSDLIEMLPRDSELKAVFERFCELRLNAAMRMTLQEAYAYARAAIEAELAGNA